MHDLFYVNPIVIIQEYKKKLKKQCVFNLCLVFVFNLYLMCDTLEQYGFALNYYFVSQKNKKQWRLEVNLL